MTFRLRFAALCAAALTSIPARAAPPSQPHEATERKGQLTKPPTLSRFVAAEYPKAELSSPRAVSVLLSLSIGADGKVADAVVIESAGEAFDAAAVAAAKRFEFSPAEIDGAPSAVKIQYRYDFTLAAANAAAAPTTSEFGGTVRDKKTGAPLAGVVVTLDDRQTVTDEAGRFTFPETSSGKHSVVLSGAGFTPVGTEELVEPGRKYAAVYDVEIRAEAPPPDEQADFEVVIVNTRLDKSVASTAVSAEQGTRIAGTGGDVLKVVENMPGVARATAGSGAVVVWGASPQDTRVYVDSVRVPLLYHFGGLRSVVHADLVKSVELVPGGYGATYGRGLGGLITVEKRVPAADRIHGSAQLDFLDASATVQGPLSKRLSMQAAVRRSHLGWALDQATSENVGEFFPVPRYYDGETAVRYSLSSRDWAEIGGLLSSDRVVRMAATSDGTRRSEQSQELTFDRAWARYERSLDDGTRVAVVPWGGRDHSRVASTFGGVATSLDVHSMNYGFRASYDGRLSDYVTGFTGIDVEATSSDAVRIGSVTSPPREGDPFVFGQPPSDQVNYDRWSAVTATAAPYGQLDLSLFSDRLHVIPGARVESFFASMSSRLPRVGENPTTGAYTGVVSFQPRLAAHYTATDAMSFKAAWGTYRQPQVVQDLSPVFGNPLLKPPQATHWLSGISVKITSLLTQEATVFYTRSEGLAVRSPLSSPVVAQALVGTGEGRSYGMQLLLRREISKGFFGWVAYTLLKSERRDNAEAPWRLFDFDQTHVLTALGSYDLGKGFEIGARFRYSTGFPRTPVVGAYYDSRRDLHQPILGERNGTRIPGFWQLDVRASKRWKIGDTELEAYLDVQNVTDHQNDEEIVYSADYSQKRYIHGLPILPIAGARWSF